MRCAKKKSLPYIVATAICRYTLQPLGKQRQNYIHRKVHLYINLVCQKSTLFVVPGLSIDFIGTALFGLVFI